MFIVVTAIDSFNWLTKDYSSNNISDFLDIFKNMCICCLEMGCSNEVCNFPITFFWGKIYYKNFPQIYLLGGRGERAQFLPLGTKCILEKVAEMEKYIIRKATSRYTNALI